MVTAAFVFYCEAKHSDILRAASHVQYYGFLKTVFCKQFNSI